MLHHTLGTNAIFFSDSSTISLTLENNKGKCDIGLSFKFRHAAQLPEFGLSSYNLYI